MSADVVAAQPREGPVGNRRPGNRASVVRATAWMATGSALRTRRGGQKIPKWNAKILTQLRQMVRWNRLRSLFISLDGAVLDAKNSGEIDFGKSQRDAFALDAAGHMVVQRCHPVRYFCVIGPLSRTFLLTITPPPRQLIFGHTHRSGQSILASISERSASNLNACGNRRLGTRR